MHLASVSKIKKDIMIQMKREHMKHLLFLAAMIAFIFIAGCTGGNQKTMVTTLPTVTQTPIIETIAPVPATITSAPVKSLTPDQGSIADKQFLAGAEACYNATPVISNITTHMTFVTCMQNTSDPKSACAVSFKHYALRYTSDDDTTAGNARQTQNAQLVREAFYKNETYNATSHAFETCT
jgi:hypothetical protein